MTSLRVSTATLRTALGTVLDHLDATGHSEVEIDQDYYWAIVDDKMLYDPLNKPVDFGLNQLSSDLDDVEGVIREKEDAIGWHLIPLAGVLRYIGGKHMG
jgi:hypothetical protein